MTRRFESTTPYLASPVFDHAPLPLFAGDPARCGRCGDVGVWITPAARIEVCPRIACGDAHNEPNDAAKLLERAGRLLAFHEVPANVHAFNVARALTRFSSADPAPRQMLLDKYFTWAGSQGLRHLHAVIEALRSVWLLPVGSRKTEPYGYYLITAEADYKEWFDRTKSAPITQLSTLHRNAKANFPVFARQLELEFPSELAAGDDAFPVAA